MKTKFSIIILTVLSLASFAQDPSHSNANIHKFVVEEVLQTTSYTYLLANEDGNKQWLALPRIKASVGEVYYYQSGMVMADFKSTELNRTFKTIIFLQSVQNANTISGKNQGNELNEAQEIKPIKIEKAIGGITIAQLIEGKLKYANKLVTIKGKVTKYNSGIMGKNWLHLQDGTMYNDKNDLIITADFNSNVGQIITVTGKIVLDKDFGSGYFYKIIMEDAQLVN